MGKDTIATKVRIRPQKIAAIISSESDQSSFTELIRFLSMVWGGKYAHIIYVDMAETKIIEIACNEIRSLQPEVIIFASEKEVIYSTIFSKICQFQSLLITKDSFEKLKNSLAAGLIYYGNVLHDEYKSHPGIERDNLFFIAQNCSDTYLSYFAVTFGFVPDNQAKSLCELFNAEFYECHVNSYSSYTDLCSKMASRLTWLGFINKSLDTISDGMKPTTIIVVNSTNAIKDLILYWNFKDNLALGGINSLFLFPESELSNSKSIKQLSQLILASPIKSNYCEIRSATCSKDILTNLAKKLRVQIKKSKPKNYYVDVKVNNSISSITFYEKEETITLTVNENEVTVPYISPAFTKLPLHSTWCCDLVKEQDTLRYPFELSLPKTKTIVNLLNLPSGSFVNFYNVIGYGREFISTIFSTNKDQRPLRFYLPTDREIFEIILSSAEVKIKKDEKNIRYSETLKLFSDLSSACFALTGISGKIINALAHKPLTYNELCGAAQLGKNKTKKVLPEIATMFLNDLYGTPKGIAEKRMHLSHSKVLTKNTPANEALEILTSMRVIRRKWKISPCLSCDKSYWVSHLDITKPIFCPGCDNLIHLKDKMDIGYELNELVRLSVVEEGITPVLLTARFLKNLTNHGYIWYPGAKVQFDKQDTDLDLLACCDASFVTGECKSLSGSTSQAKWNEIRDQLILPIEVAKKCGFSVFFVSSFTDNYSRKFKADLKKIAGDNLKLLFICGKDLEQGYSEVKDHEGSLRKINMHSILTPQDKNRTRKSNKAARTIWF